MTSNVPYTQQTDAEGPVSANYVPQTAPQYPPRGAPQNYPPQTGGQPYQQHYMPPPIGYQQPVTYAPGPYQGQPYPGQAPYPYGAMPYGAPVTTTVIVQDEPTFPAARKLGVAIFFSIVAVIFSIIGLIGNAGGWGYTGSGNGRTTFGWQGFCPANGADLCFKYNDMNIGGDNGGNAMADAGRSTCGLLVMSFLFGIFNSVICCTQACIGCGCCRGCRYNRGVRTLAFLVAAFLINAILQLAAWANFQRVAADKIPNYKTDWDFGLQVVSTVLYAACMLLCALGWKENNAANSRPEVVVA